MEIAAIVVQAIPAIICILSVIRSIKSEKLAKKYAEDANKANKSAQKYFEDMSRPCVEAFMGYEEKVWGMFVENTGSITAFGVQSKISDDTILTSLQTENFGKSLGSLLENEYVLIPKHNMFFPFVANGDSFKNIKDKILNIELRYRDSRGNQYMGSFSFKFSAYAKLIEISEQDKMLKAVESISESIRGFHNSRP